MKNTQKTLREALALAAAFYEKDGRALPWRRDFDPYHIFLSEIMLQQTRVEAVIPYYERFLTRFPTVRALADASDEEVFKLWEGLGYYSRARNLLRAARRIVAVFDGVFPPSYADLLSLPGVGEYTAGAIGSIAFGLPTSAIDGNALRIYARLFADERNILDPKIKAQIKADLDAVYPSAEAARYTTQGLMEVGQRFCLPNGAPHCDGCPLFSLCAAGKNGSWQKYPCKEKKKPRRILKKTVLLCECDGHFYLRKRPNEGLLAGLWEFPNVDGHLSAEDAAIAARELGLSQEGAVFAVRAKHIFTHLEWHMQSYLIPCGRDVPQGFVLATREEMKTLYAIPSAFRAFLNYMDDLEK